MRSIKDIAESLLDIDQGSKNVDELMDICGTTKKVLNRMKHISPVYIDNLLTRAIEGDAEKILRQELCKTDIEAEAVKNFFVHMFHKYQNILMVEWVDNVDWEEFPRLYKIHKNYTDDDLSMIQTINLWVDKWNKVDSWIAGIDEAEDASFFLSTSKDMTKEEKQTWKVLMKLVEKYYD